MRELLSIDIEIEGITVIAYIDMKGENSYITSGVLKLLTYEKNEIKYGRALISIQDEYLLTKGYFKQLYFFCEHVIMKYPMYIVSEEEEEVYGMSAGKKYQIEIFFKKMFLSK